MTNLICYTFGHSLKHLYDCDFVEINGRLTLGPEYIKLIYCSRRYCGYEMELS
jgi:hypothetical protein